MSAFLGPIHTWLFRKIRFQYEFTAAIIQYAEQEKLIENLSEQVNNRYGSLENGELADLIDEGNIHGWLQERVTLVENRLAYVVTMITDEHPDRIMEINDAAYEFGKGQAMEQGISVKDAYAFLEAALLNGMPCDRVNEVISESDEQISWRQTTNIHEQYWNMIHGNPEYYDLIRESLILGMVEESGIGFYQLDAGIFELRKEK